MPTLRRSCSFPGCGKPLPCLKHTKFRRRRDTAAGGYGAEHRDRFRAGVLSRDPTCVLCGRPATVADHYPLSRRELVRRGLDPNNPLYGRGLCASCHSGETTRNQPGGFNAPR
jgi:5-methylcytosine-specific restriction protein A